HRGGVRRPGHQPPDVLRMADEEQSAQVHHLAERQPAHPPVRIRAVAGIARGGRLMEDGTTYDVRVYRTEVYKGARVTTYRVRWKVGCRLSAEDFRNAAQADSFRSSLLTAARKGEGFSLSTGRPVSWSHDESAITWYAVALDYTAAKWPYAAPNRRKSIAEALTDATEAMLVSDELPYPVEDIRRALRTWAFSDRLRGATEPPEDLSAIVCWLQTATLPVADLSRPGIGAARCRALLNRISRKQDRTAAAANTANRKRAVLNNLMQYAI